MKIDSVRSQVETFLSDTSDARTLSERCRDYFDGRQWTEAEAQKLRARHQAPITVNRVKPKVEGLLGLYNLRRTDPKAYPRNAQDEEAAHVVTDGLRYVADNNDFDSLKLEVADNFFVEGYGGAMVSVRDKKGEKEIVIQGIPWDRIYYQPQSRAKDFSDARWMGVILWMDVDEAKEKLPNADIDACVKEQGATDRTFEDRPRWVDSKRDRIRVALHYEIHNGVWHMAIACGDVFLVKPQVSPFLDEDGEPACNIELVSAFVDRDNGRYGEVAGFLDQQDEINHRRSKFLHYLNTKQTFGRQGALQGEHLKNLKREKQKPDGHLEFNGDQFGKDFGFLPNDGADIGQFNLYIDAKGELDAVSFNAQLSGDRQQGDLSGVAIGKLQQAGTLEVNRQYSLLANWEKRIYRQIFARQKQFWTEEKWIRVTDNQDNLRFIGFNTPVTVEQALTEKINDESESYFVRRQAAELFTTMIQSQDPKLQEVVEIRNPIPELDMDIIIDQSFDVINIEEEQFKMLAQFANGADVDLLDLIEMSQLRDKDALIEKIQARRDAAAQAAGGAKQLAMKEAESKIANTQADTTQKFTKAQQTQVETELLLSQPPDSTNVII